MKTAEQTEIKCSDLTFRWVDGYYDGMLSGFAIWRGRLCYFDICDDSTDNRRFTVHSLNEDEATNAVRNCDEFKALHRNRNDLLPDGSHAGGICLTALEEAAAAGDATSARLSV